MPERARASSSPSVKVCVPIIGPSLAEALSQIERARKWADLIELRLDMWSPFDLEGLRQIDFPSIFTVRSPKEGGHFRGSEVQRRQLLSDIFSLEPEYVDLELFSLDLAEHRRGKTKIIGSVHGEIPKGKLPKADLYKVVLEANRIEELFELYKWAEGRSVIPLCMGRHGPLSRLLAPLVGSPIVYASLDEEHETAKGQIPARELREVYHYGRLSHETRLLGVVGESVAQSPGKWVHNAVLRRLHVDAIYLPIPLKPEECLPFLDLCRRFNPIGLSVTMPHKERVAALVGSEEGAINTLCMRGGKWEGCNTDGIGALDAIERHILVSDRRVAIVGAGGTARAIAYEAKRRGATVCLYNRTESRARRVAEELGVGALPLAQLERDPYDILVQATPVSPIPTSWIRRESLLLDVIIHPRETELLAAARACGAIAIPGIEMYAQQAIHQLTNWFSWDYKVCEKAVWEAINGYLHCTS